ncbi:MAG: NTP transferase domain-containing protein [Ancalomicrobiaceae bacterium]|nr:NTP transferase domain-containing protein [Ancalomicrobiaceae bacterium]
MRKPVVVIPAAGRGTRLGLDRPKILAPITAQETIWSVLAARLAPLAERICVVMSPWGETAFRDAIAPDMAARVDVVLQPQPLGMGHAVFCGADSFSGADTVLVVWGDQINVGRDTIVRTCERHAGRKRTVVIPTVLLQSPYVEYRFGEDGRLARILETREGDTCAPVGFADVGTFLLSVEGLASAWASYVAVARLGAATGELNFLPFLVYLANNGWLVEQIVIDDPGEARGVNTKDDLEFAMARLGQA